MAGCLGRGKLFVAVVLAAVIAAAGSASAQKAHLSASGPLGGINIGSVSPGESFAEVDREIALAQSLHARVVRTDLQWSSFEPEGRGQISTAGAAVLSHLMSDATAAHIGVIALIAGTPCWASSAPAALLASCSDSGDSAAHAWPPRQASAFGSFVGWLAKTYGPGLIAIEVWNEPDQANQDYLAGPNKPRHYAELLKAAYPAVKKADPKIKVLAGSLVGSNGTFMKALYKQGVKGYYDGVAVHFYNLVIGSVRRFHEVQMENHDRAPLWLDEFGWSSCWPGHRIEQEQGCVTEKLQAQDITESFRELAKARYVAALLTYGLQDIPGEEFGVLNSAGARKPSFYALSGVLRSPFGPLSPVTLKLRAKKGQVIASGSGPVGDYLKLEAFQHGVLRYHAIFTLDRFNDYTIKLPKVLGTHGLTVRVYQYWLGRGHDAQRSI
jgi:hypothetical protein